MKFKDTKLIILAILALIAFSGYPQASYNGYKSSRANSAMAGIVSTGNPFNLNLQVGAVAPFDLPANSSAIIPQVGLDFNFGSFGLRASGQFFKTSPEFDMGAYLAPISGSITQKGTDQNSNTMFGLSPYFNLSLRGFTLQPSLGIHYLMQKGADLSASYDGLPDGAVLDATTGTLDRSAVMLSPNIRAILGKANKPLQFFAEAAYNMAVGIKEYKITSRNLEGVILPDGSIDPDLMGVAGTTTHNEKLMPGNFTIGVGVSLNIAASGNHNTSRSNRTPHVVDFGKDSLNPSCRCNISMMNFDGNPINDGGQIQVSIGHNGALNFSGSCPNNCNMKYYWEIFDPAGNSSGAIYDWNTSYQFTQSGTYTCVAMIDCGGTICQKSFTVVIKPGNDPLFCECSITDMKVNNSNISVGDTRDLSTSTTSSATLLEFDGNCSPPDFCGEPSFFWEITRPNGLIDTYPGNIINYHFSDIGLYSCVAHWDCSGFSGYQNCQSSKIFYINSKIASISNIPSRTPGPSQISSNTGLSINQFMSKNAKSVPNAEIILTQFEFTSDGKRNNDRFFSSVDHFAFNNEEYNPKKVNPISQITTNKSGEYKFAKPQKLNTGGKKSKKTNYIIVNIPTQFIQNLNTDSGKEGDLRGIYTFQLEIQTSQEPLNELITLDLRYPNDPKAETLTLYSQASGGPYSQSVSNMEDDGIISIPIPIEDVIEVLYGSLRLNTVNHYGIHDEGIK